MDAYRLFLLYREIGSLVWNFWTWRVVAAEAATATAAAAVIAQQHLETYRCLESVLELDEHEQGEHSN